MNKILIIPDIHGRNFWDKPITDIIDNKLNVDKIIFLGDYFDPYSMEGISEYDAMINWFNLINKVKCNISPNKYIFLIGNHDAHYISDVFCNISGGSRFSFNNYNAIKGIFQDNVDLFQLAHEEVVDGKKILFTHAGITNIWVDRHKGLLDNNCDAYHIRELIHSKRGWKALAECGFFRGGNFLTGSPLWSDINEHFNLKDNQPLEINGYNYQIFGHTMQKQPIINDVFAMLDCQKPFIMDDKCNLNVYE